METVSRLIVPLVMCLVGSALLLSKKDMFSVFTDGAIDGMNTAVRLLPTLVALLAAISMFNASGASAALATWLAPMAEKIGIPGEIIPLVLVRPLSGGASTALIADIFEKYGADSFVGRCASVIAGSSDTILYVVSVYFGAVGIKKTRGTVPISFIVMVFSVFFAVFLCRFFFEM
ncbi:MAG: spore maturation protein [Ruminococcaceae bacterium]|nr:spore maturation protein [Oscillospiraceae bacterium]